MSEQLRLRGDVAANVAAYVGPSRETVVDTTNNRLVVQDGVTPGGWPAAKLAEVNRVARATISASYSAQPGDRLIAIAGIVAPIYVTLPAAASFQPGARLLVIDESGAASFSKAISVIPSSGDAVVGAYSSVIVSAYGFIELESNGAGQWTVSDAVAAASPSAATGVAGATSAAAAFSGQALVALSQPVFSAVLFEPRLKAGMRPVVGALNPAAALTGLLASVNLTGFAPGEIAIFGVVKTLDGRIAPSQKARMVLTLTYIGA